MRWPELAYVDANLQRGCWFWVVNLLVVSRSPAFCRYIPMGGFAAASLNVSESVA